MTSFTIFRYTRFALFIIANIARARVYCRLPASVLLFTLSLSRAHRSETPLSHGLLIYTYTDGAALVICNNETFKTICIGFFQWSERKDEGRNRMRFASISLRYTPPPERIYFQLSILYRFVYIHTYTHSRYCQNTWPALLLLLLFISSSLSLSLSGTFRQRVCLAVTPFATPIDLSISICVIFRRIYTFPLTEKMDFRRILKFLYIYTLVSCRVLHTI